MSRFSLTPNFLAISRSKLAKNAFFNVIALFIPTILTLISSPLLINLLGSVTYGYWLTFRSLVGFTGVLEFNIGAALEQRIPGLIAQENYREISTLLSLAATLYLALFGGLLLLIIVFHNFLNMTLINIFPNDSVKEVIVLLFATFVLISLSSLGQSVIRALQKYQWITFLKTFQFVILFGTAIGVSLFSPTFEAMLFVTAGSSLFNTAATLFVCYKLLLKNDIQLKFSRSTKHFRSVINFSSAGTLSSVGSQLFSTFDKVVVNAILGPQAVTTYSLAILIPSQILTVSGAISATLMPSISALWSSKQYVQTWKQTLQVSKFIFLALGFGCLLLYVGAEFFLFSWVGELATSELIESFRIFIVVYFGISIITPSHYVSFAVGLPWAPALATLFSGGITLLSIAFFASRYGIIGAAIGNLAYWVNFSLVAFTLYHIRPKSVE